VLSIHHAILYILPVLFPLYPHYISLHLFYLLDRQTVLILLTKLLAVLHIDRLLIRQTNTGLSFVNQQIIEIFPDDLDSESFYILMYARQKNYLIRWTYLLKYEMLQVDQTFQNKFLPVQIKIKHLLFFHRE